MVTPKHSVFLFIGDDKYLKEKALKDLKSSLLVKSPDQSDHITFYGSELDEGDVFDQLNTIPLLSDKRLVVIKEIEKVSDEFRASLIAYIKKPSKFAYLVMDAESDSVLKDYDEALKQISVRNFGPPAGADLESWIKDYLSSSGKAIKDNALLILREFEGSGLSYISQELDKLITFVGDRREIGTDDVEGIIGASLIVSVFDITDAIARRDTAGAIKITSSLIMNGKRVHEIIGIICWHLKRILKARTLKDRGESDYAIASALRIGRKFQNNFFRQLAVLDSEKVKSNIEILLQADLDIKRSKFDPATILEFAIIKLCLLQRRELLH